METHKINGVECAKYVIRENQYKSLQAVYLMCGMLGKVRVACALCPAARTKLPKIYCGECARTTNKFEGFVPMQYVPMLLMKGFKGEHFQ